MNEHTSKQYDADLASIRATMLSMGGLVETQVSRAIEALKSGEVDLAEEIEAAEGRINHLQMQVDEQCDQIIVKRQPTAVDLRMVMMFVKTANDLERVGDEAKKIARKAQKIHASERLALVRFHDISRVSELAREMLQMALDALARLDVKAAAEVVRRDESLDQEFKALIRLLVSYMMEDPRTISSALELVFIAKSIERIGDHAKNIAEYIVHVVKGKDMRHATAEEIRHEIGG
ncbi:MAG: phosphate signaling complex protein PhoU [Burkholderiales bacterium]